ncbi:hypothetical protein [Xenorhabdus ehlersii]|uniref:hypothetical protein n=1 Tax=Xenorhabdus ehlersii TaxID=290111 RepID=UPI00117E4E34|nr:hypothetical protein [Xenorhabdus ehlersii]
MGLNVGLAETVKRAKNAYPKTGGTIEGKVWTTSDIEATGWIGGTTLHDRHTDGRWSQVYSEAHKPEPREIGVYSTSESNGRFALKKSHDMFSCGGVDVEATHDWAGVKLKNANGYYVQLSAVPHEKPEMLTVFYRDSTTETQYYVNLRKKSGEIALLSDVAENASIGINQSWQNVRYKRIGGTQYKNDAGKPIAVFVKTKPRKKQLGAIGIGANVNGIQVAYNWSDFDGPQVEMSVFFIVPTGAHYDVNAYIANDGDFIDSWVELR